MKIFVAILMSVWCAVAVAEPASVIDNVRANMRSGKGENYRTLRSLPAKTMVEVLESDGEYSKVQLEDGQTGWVKSSLLAASKAPAPVEATVQAMPSVDLTAIQKELVTAREQLVKMQGELEQERALTKGEPQHSSLILAALAGLAVGVIIGMLVLRAHYLRRLHGLRI
jgi:uncharacterized protein YgiM (DUF1202 family)